VPRLHRDGRLVPLLILATLVGCVPDDDDPFRRDERTLPDPHLVVGEEVTCADPTAGFDRFTDTAEARGIDLVAEPYLELRGCPPIPGSVAAQDLDGDGAVDLLFQDPDSFPIVYANDGSGGFQRVPQDVTSPEELWVQFGALDLDGDGDSDVVLVKGGMLAVSWNEGGFAFGEPEVLWQDLDWPRPCIASLAWGDVDGDGDLDLVLPRLFNTQHEDWILPNSEVAVGTYSLLLINHDGVFEEAMVLDGYGQSGLSIMAVFTDRDHDGDQDILLASEFGPLPHIPPCSFWRNDGASDDGAPVLINDAPEVGADASISAMGLASADFNQDGLLDYCVSTVGPGPMCLYSFQGGPYVESGPVMGLESALLDLPEGCGICWSMWSIVIEDFEGDGELDAAIVAGPPPDGGSVTSSELPLTQPDAIWQGDGSGGFVERTYDLGFNDTAWNFGMVSADLDRDGYRELIVQGFEGRPRILDNPCAEGTWIAVDLVGLPANREGFGARIEVHTADRSRVREVHGLHAVSQQPSELRFGLGQAGIVEELAVSWPDGARSTFADVPVNRLVTVHHPALEL